MKTATETPTWHGGATGAYRCPCGKGMHREHMDAGEYRSQSLYRCEAGHRWRQRAWAGGERWEESDG